MKGLLVFLILGLSLAHALTPEERQKEFMRLREEMHQRLREELFNGPNSGSPFEWMDAMGKRMEALMDDRLPAQTQAQWEEGRDGRTLVLTPPHPKAKLDVSVANGMVTVKSAFEQGHSEWSQSVPQDCNADAVKMQEKAGRLVLFFPYKGVQNGPVPLTPKPGDIET